jgi:hypothetical protein
MSFLAKALRPALVLASLTCYVAACSTSALELIGVGKEAGQNKAFPGLLAFIDGFFAMFEGQYAWLANPLALLALITLCIRLRRLSLCLSVLALLVAQHTWWLVGTVIDGDEGGVTKFRVVSLGTGFYLWTTSFFLLAIASLGRKADGLLARVTLPPPSSSTAAVGDFPGD